jgi:sulfite oxidase
MFVFVVILNVASILIISDEESKSHWQQKDYKSLSPTITENPDYSKFTAIQSVPVTSAICEPKPGSSLKVTGDSGSVFVKGYAYSGGGNSVVRVDVSSDGGEVERAPDAPAPPRNW